MSALSPFFVRTLLRSVRTIKTSDLYYSPCSEKKIRFISLPLLMCIVSARITSFCLRVAGVWILVTPTLVIDGDSFPVLTGLSGDLFCRMVFSQYFVYAMSKVSVFTVTVMSLERWYSIVRPFQYRANFNMKRIHIYLVLIWLLGLGSVGFIPFGRVFISPTNACVWSWAPFHRELLIALFPLLTFFAPALIACLTLLHTYFVLKRPRVRQTGNRNTATKRKLLRMCSIVVFLFFFCWLPNQLYYALSAYNITTLETSFHYFTIVLAMSNSSLNPWVYCFANRQIKTGIMSFFNPVLNPLRKCVSPDANSRNGEGGEVPIEMQNRNGAFELSCPGVLPRMERTRSSEVNR